jgi:hypothetical protein
MKRSTRALKTLLVLAALVPVLGAAAAWQLGLASWAAHEGYFGPALSPDGRFVYVMVRRTTGATWVNGIFEQPTGAFPIGDRVSLVRIEVEGGQLDVLETWPSTPLVRRVVHASLGNVFAVMHTVIRADESGAVHYTAEFLLPGTPLADVRQMSGVWTERPEGRQRGEWQHVNWQSHQESEPIVAGNTEVFAVAGPASFPSAVLLLDHATRTATPVAYGRAYRTRYPSGPPIDELLTTSRKPEIDRLAMLKRRQAELVAENRARGATENDALLRSYRTLEDEGLMPRSRAPRIVAKPLSTADLPGVASLPLFEIAEGEMASGVFRDIENAIHTPGEEVEKSSVPYVVHRDYSNSAQLNAYLASGRRAFVVRYRGASYRIEIRTP